MVTILLWWYAEYCSIARKDEGSMYLLDFSKSNELCRCCLQKWKLFIICGEQPRILMIVWTVWDFLQKLLTNFSIRYNRILVLEASFGDKILSVPWVSVSPIIWQFHFIAFMYLYILENFYCVVSILPLNWPLILALSSCISFLIPPYEPFHLFLFFQLSHPVHS